MPIEVFGSNRADTLIGGDEENFLYPRGIFDEPPSSTAFDVVFGGLGNDLLYLDCQGETQSVYLGTAGNPRFILSPTAPSCHSSTPTSVVAATSSTLEVWLATSNAVTSRICS